MILVPQLPEASDFILFSTFPRNANIEQGIKQENIVSLKLRFTHQKLELLRREKKKKVLFIFLLK